MLLLLLWKHFLKNKCCFLNLKVGRLFVSVNYKNKFYIHIF